MTKDEIIRMAEQAGLATYISPACHPTALNRFADLVAAAEREACAKVCDTLDVGKHEGVDDLAEELIYLDCASAIRARSNKGE